MVSDDQETDQRLQKCAHLFFLSSIFSLPLSADDYKCFRSMKQEINDLFLIQLKVDWCVVLFRAEAIKHNLHLKPKVKEIKLKIK